MTEAELYKELGILTKDKSKWEENIPYVAGLLDHDSEKIHGVGSVIGFMLFLFVPLPVGILSFKSGEGIVGVASIICFVIAMVFFALFVMADKPEFANTVVGNEGLWQRLNLIFMYGPLIIVAIRQMIMN